MAADFNKLDSFFSVDNSSTGPKPKKKLNHGQRVRLAKLILPCIAAFLLSLLVIIPQLRQHVNEIKIDITRPKTGELEKLHVENTIFYITDKNNTIHNITAENIDETEPGSKLIKITQPEGTMPSANGTWMNIKSPTGIYDQNVNTLTLTDGVNTFYSDGIMMETPTMVHDFQTGISHSNSPVEAEGFFGNLQSQGFNYDTNTGILIFTGKTNINLDEQGLEGNNSWTNSYFWSRS